MCAFSVTLQVLYKLKTAKLFDATKSRVADVGDNIFAVNMIFLCVESRLLCIAGAEYVLLFKFSKQESLVDCPVCLNVSWLFPRVLCGFKNGLDSFAGRTLYNAPIPNFALDFYVNLYFIIFRD